MKRILVTGVGGPAGRNVAQLLLQRGYTVIGVDMRPVSLAGIQFHLVPAANAPHFLEELSRLAREEDVDLLIPTVTEELPVIAAGWSRFSPIPAMISPSDAVSRANDKYLTAEWLAERKVGVPRYTLPSRVRTPEDVEQLLGWPCLSKPRVGRGGREVRVWQRADWPSITALDDHYILQEFIPGTDYAPNVFIGRKGGASVVVLEKTKLKDGIVGNALEVQRADAPDVADLAVRAAQAMGLIGPLDIDIRRRADGEPVVLEINARFGANIAVVPEILDAALADWGMTP